MNALASLAVLLLFPLIAWSEVPPEDRVIIVKYDPITERFIPPMIPSAKLINNQRYRTVIAEQRLDGSIQTKGYFDFTYTGPTHPPGRHNPFGANQVKDAVPGPHNTPVKIHNAGPSGLPTIQNDQNWFKGDGLDSPNPDLGIVVPPYAPPEQKKNSKPPSPPPKQSEEEPRPRPDRNSDLPRALGMNTILAALSAFRETPEDRRLRKEFEQRQQEIYTRQQALEKQLSDTKVESAKSLVQALTLFEQTATSRPSVDEVKNRIAYARKYGDPDLFKKLMDSPFDTWGDVSDGFFGSESRDYTDFIKTTFEPAAHAENFYMMATGHDSHGNVVSEGKMAGLLLKYTSYLTGGKLVYSVASNAELIGRASSFAGRVVPWAADKIVASPASLIAVAVYAQGLNVNEDEHFKSLHTISDPALKNAARVFYNGQRMGNDNLANNVLGETYAAWANPHIKLRDTELASDMYKYLNNWSAKNPNAKVLDQNVANEMLRKLKLSLDFKLPETPE